MLDERSKMLRRLILRALAGGGRGHVGSALSLVEILRVLYDDVLRYRPEEPLWPERDRCILSKGHGCLALYAVLADKGFFPAAEFDRFCHLDGILGGHPEAHRVPGVEASTGSLGHGLSIGVGMALSARHESSSRKVFVIIGDGESGEGSVWEAALSAAKHRLSNLCVITDYNKQQSYGPLESVLPLEPLADKWKSFGWEVAECDGHDVKSLGKALAQLKSDKPHMLIAHTIKGCGIKAAEHNPSWHHKNKVSAEEIKMIEDELR